jgi:predicted Zn-ribbon and HTH transcriptional regulator
MLLGLEPPVPVPIEHVAKWGQAAISSRSRVRDRDDTRTGKEVMFIVSEPSSHVPAAEAETDAGLPLGKAPLRCAECGYEIRSYRVLPPCPMCRELCWEPAPWRPFTSPRAA